MTSPIDLINQHVKLPFPSWHKYQEEDITRACLADSFLLGLDVGLGKTACSIATGVYKILSGNFDRCYVLVPANLIAQWISVIKSFGLTTAAYEGIPKQRAKIDREVDFLVMSYQIYQNDYHELIKGVKPYYIIDEATVLCNKNNLLFKMLQGGKVKKSVPPKPPKIKPEIITTNYEKQNRGCSLLTATPVNTPLDAFGLVSIINPTAYRNYSQFCRVHVAETNQWNAASEYDNLDLLKQNLMLNATIRHATDHIDLPPIVFKTVKYQLSPEHMKLYNKIVQEKVVILKGQKVIDAISANSLYHTLQKIILRPDIAGFTKEPVGLEVLDGLVNSADKYLIFANYTGSNDIIMERYGIGGVYGKVGSKEKKEYIEAFKEGRLNGMTVHCKSGGIGLDMPTCNKEFYPELPITPRDFYQAVGRVYRQGQQERVVVVVMYAEKTIQATLFKKIMDKDDLMREVIESPKSLRRDLFEDVIEANEPKSLDQLTAELRGE